MELKENSVLSKIYRWFYGLNYMPNNLCEYFWRLVFMFVFIMPSAILSFPYNIIQYVSNKRSNFKLPNNNTPLNGVVIWFGLLLISCILVAISLFFNTYETGSNLDTMSKIGIALLVGGSLLFIVIGIVNLIHSNVTSKSNIVVEFVKAKKNKYCPKIDWK